MKKIDSVCTLTLGTSAQTVRVSGLACLVQNNSDSASVYMKERRADGTDEAVRMFGYEDFKARLS